jgi:hypothetical protein
MEHRLLDGRNRSTTTAVLRGELALVAELTTEFAQGRVMECTGQLGSRQPGHPEVLDGHEIVLSIDEQKGLAKGSARSIKGFDMYQALRQCEDILPHFGGHPMAAGMTLKAHDVDQLRIRLDQLGEQWLTEEDFVPITLTDITCSIDEVTIEAVDELEESGRSGEVEEVEK